MCRPITIFLLTLALFTTLVACTTSPTGRKQLTMFSDQQLAAQGSAAFTDMKSKIPASTNTNMRSYVSCVTDALLSRMGENPSEWEVVVFAQPQLNAFALPGKKIGVYEGIFQAATNQHMLAAVIGHEIGHVQARHSNERMSANAASNMLVKAVQVVGVLAGSKEASEGGNSSGVDPKVLAAIGIGLQYGVMLPYGRQHESEADLIGLKLMSQAGFDPRESVKLWQNMARLGGAAPPEFLSTHPSPKTRINDLNSAIPSVYGLYQQVPKKPSCS